MIENKRIWKVAISNPENPIQKTLEKYFSNQSVAIAYADSFLNENGLTSLKNKLLELVSPVSDVETLNKIQTGDLRVIDEFPFGEFPGYDGSMPEAITEKSYTSLQVKEMRKIEDGTWRRYIYHTYLFEDSKECAEFSTELSRASRFWHRKGSDRAFLPSPEAEYLDRVVRRSYGRKPLNRPKQPSLGTNVEIVSKGRAGELLNYLSERMEEASPHSIQPDDDRYIWKVNVKTKDVNAASLSHVVHYFPRKEDAIVFSRIISEKFTVSKLNGASKYTYLGNPAIERVKRSHVPTELLSAAEKPNSVVEKYLQRVKVNEATWDGFVWTFSVSNKLDISGENPVIFAFSSRSMAKSALDTLNREMEKYSDFYKDIAVDPYPRPRDKQNVEMLNKKKLLYVDTVEQVLKSVSALRSRDDFELHPTKLATLLDQIEELENEARSIIHRFVEEMRPQVKKFLPEELHVYWDSNNIEPRYLALEDGYITVSVRGGDVDGSLVYSGMFPQEMFSSDAAIRKNAISECSVHTLEINIPENSSPVP